MIPITDGSSDIEIAQTCTWRIGIIGNSDKFFVPVGNAGEFETTPGSAAKLGYYVKYIVKM